MFPARAPSLSNGSRASLAALCLAAGACTAPNPVYMFGSATGPSADGSIAGFVGRDGAGIGDAISSRAFCPNDSDLLACFRFENNLVDDSPAGLVATATGVSYAASPSGLALVVLPGARAQVPDANSLDTTRLTIEALINPRMLPVAGGRAGIVDYQRQYSLWLQPNGSVACAIRGTSDLVLTAAVAPGEWTAIACTVDATRLSMYRNGVLMIVAPTEALDAPSGPGGLEIGGNVPTTERPNPDALDGAIDNLRIWRRVRTAREICQDGGSGTPCP